MTAATASRPRITQADRLRALRDESETQAVATYDDPVQRTALAYGLLRHGLDELIAELDRKGTRRAPARREESGPPQRVTPLRLVSDEAKVAAEAVAVEPEPGTTAAVPPTQMGNAQVVVAARPAADSEIPTSPPVPGPKPKRGRHRLRKRHTPRFRAVGRIVTVVAMLSMLLFCTGDASALAQTSGARHALASTRLLEGGDMNTIAGTGSSGLDIFNVLLTAVDKLLGTII